MRSAILHPAASHSAPHLRRVAAAPPRSHRLATPPRQRRSARAGAAILEGTAMGRHGRSRGRGHSQRAPEPLVDTPHSTTPGSAPRKWVAPPDTTPDAHGVRLRFMSYNILSEDIRRSTSFLYRDVRDPACCWPHRRQLISREVAHYGADVVSMQVCAAFSFLSALPAGHDALREAITLIAEAISLIAQARWSPSSWGSCTHQRDSWFVRIRAQHERGMGV